MDIGTLALLSTLALQTSIYKCTVDGQVIFSQTECAEDAEELNSKALAQETGMRADPTVVNQANRKRAARAVDHRENQMRRESNKLIAEFEGQINLCRRRASRALNNLAGATYDQTQQQCIANYQKMISEERQALEERVLQMRSMSDN